MIHPHLALDAGDAYVAGLEQARRGALGAFVLVVEGTMFDQALAGAGWFSRIGTRDGVPVTVEQWVADLAAGAEAMVAIGTCATWGGVPAAAGSVTGAMGVGALLGDGYRGRAGLPLVTVPGCAPSGDAFLETLQYPVLHLEGVVPLDLDDHGRPRWLYAEETPLVGVRTVTARPEPTRGLTAGCPVPRRGWINRLGGAQRSAVTASAAPGRTSRTSRCRSWCARPQRSPRVLREPLHRFRRGRQRPLPGGAVPRLRADPSASAGGGTACGAPAFHLRQA